MEKVESPIYSKEHAEQIVFGEAKRILRNLGLTPEQLKNKKVADIGAGDRLISAFCFKNNITKEVYSIDPIIANSLRDRKFIEHNFTDLGGVKEKSVAGRKESIPFGDNFFDIVILHGVFLFHGACDDVEKEKIDKTLDETIRVARAGGEIIIWPFYPEVGPIHREEEREKYKNWRKVVLDKLEKLKFQGLCEVIFEYAPAHSFGKEIEAQRIIIRKN
jgi:ubiquinone/menaquinone biosynthesis C-methylase UbiE